MPNIVDYKKHTPILGDVSMGVVPDSYYELKFKVGDKWYTGYYEHLWGGSFNAYAWCTRHYTKQKAFQKNQVTEWHYLLL